MSPPGVDNIDVVVPTTADGDVEAAPATLSVRSSSGSSTTRTFGARAVDLARMPLVANSFWLLLSSAANYGFGFLFWLAAARSYSPADVGVGAVLLSAGPMLAFVGTFGFGATLIRYVPLLRDDAPRLANLAITVVTITALSLTFIFLAGLDVWSPALRFVRDQPAYIAVFAGYVALQALAGLLGDLFTALRNAKYATIASVVQGAGKTAGAIAFASLLGGAGILTSSAAALIVTVGLCIFLFLPSALPGFRPRPSLPRNMLRLVASFSLANHLAEGIRSASGWLLPFLILHMLGPEETATFVITWGIATLPLVVPTAIASALFAEVSHDPSRISSNVWRSIELSALALIPMVAGLYVVGDRILLLYGQQYAAGQPLMVAGALSVLPGTLITLYLSIARARNALRELTAFAVATTSGMLGLSALLIPQYGTLGVGIATLTTYTTVAIIVLWRLRAVLKSA